MATLDANTVGALADLTGVSVRTPAPLRPHRPGGAERPYPGGLPRRRALRAEGGAMSMDEAISYALANIDPKLLTGPIASIGP